MSRSSIFAPRRRSVTKEGSDPSLSEDRQDLVEVPARRNRAARGAIIGVLLGVVLWAAILVLLGVIKLKP